MGWASGTFTRLHSWVADANTRLDILADRMDADTNDIVAGLNNTLTRDGQNVPLGNLPMGTFKHTGVAPATNPTDYARFDQILPATGNGTITGNLTVTGTLTAAVGEIGGATSLTGTGITTTNLHATGPAALDGDLTVGGTLTAAAAQIGGSVTINSTGLTTNNLHATASVVLDGNLTVAGAVAAASANFGGVVAAASANFSGDIAAANANFSGNLAVAVTATIGNLDVTGTGAINSLTISNLYFNPAQQVLSSTAPPPGARILYLA